MKSHFLKLFDYDLYANRLIMGIIQEAGNPPKAMQLMNHLLTAQQIWYNRCNGLPPVAGTLWDNEITKVSLNTMENDHKNWTGYINSLEDHSFNELISYKTTSGINYTDKLEDICTHVINHGTHHRAQIGWELKMAGIEKLPLTDYIFYLRDI
jgi:uncharacterized damage-inducible protein DinB